MTTPTEMQRLRAEKDLTIRTLEAFEREIKKDHSQRELLRAWNAWYHLSAKPLLDRLKTPTATPPPTATGNPPNEAADL